MSSASIVARVDPQRRSLTRRDYRVLTEAGVFDGRRVELLAGEIYEHMAAMLSPHATSVRKFTRLFSEAFAPQSIVVNVQLPIILDDESEPEPDLALARGEDDDFALEHPRPASLVLVVEVSDSTLRFDRNLKADNYARARISDYWILNIEERQLEVLRQPIPNPASSTGWRFAARSVLREADFIAPLFAPQTLFSVAQMLPRASSE